MERCRQVLILIRFCKRKPKIVTGFFIEFATKLVLLFNQIIFVNNLTCPISLETKCLHEKGKSFS